MRLGRRSRAAVGALVLAVATVVALPSTAGAKVRRPKPRWDPDVERIAHEVEHIRGLKFDGPVTVHFTPAHVFDEVYSEPVDAGYRRDLVRQERAQRALGLLDADDDVVESLEESGTGGLLGLYDGDIDVRGSDDDILTQYVLAHELTHALHDDNFNTYDLAIDESDPLALAGLAALEEGDADRVAEEWIARQPRAKRARLDREYADLFGHGDDLGPFSEVSISEGGAPYLFGEEFTAAVLATGGQRALDRLFDDPPSDDGPVFDPLRDVHRSTENVGPPAVDDGDERVGHPATFGALGFFHLLASRIDPLMALDAADRWSGDALVLFRRDGVDCVRARFATRGADGAVVTAALQTWSAAHGAATVTADDRRTTVTACASDATTPLPQSIIGADVVVATRNRILQHGLQEGASADQLACAVAAYLDDHVLVNEMLAINPVTTEPTGHLLGLAAERRRVTRSACGFDPGRVLVPNR